MSQSKVPEPSEIAKRTEAAAIEKFHGPIDGITSACGTWIKVKASYEDKWKTPMAGAKFDLYLEQELILEGKHLKDYEQVGLTPGEGPPKDEIAALAWQQKYDELGTFYHPSCEKGKAYFEIVSDPSVESQISQLDDAIEASLDGAYRNLETNMSGFRQQWQALGSQSILYSIGAGAKEGAGDIAIGVKESAIDSYEWAKDLENWYALWDDIEKTAVESGDWAQQSAANAWFVIKNTSTADVKAAAQQAASKAKSVGDALAQSVEESIESAGAIYEKAQTIYAHRKAIMNLPNQIIAKDINSIENFIDITLHDIDPDWAIQLKYDKSWQNTLELMNYEKSVTVYIAYGQLFFETIPPNFYTYYFGKGGIYIIYEFVLFLIGMLLGGIGAAARLAVITARIAKMSAKSTQLIDKSNDALRSFLKATEGLARAGEKMAEQAPLLTKAHRAETKNGVAGNTVEKQRTMIKKNKNCRICDSDKHKTPVSRKGNLKYVL
jgi:hypothetical protein